MLACESVAEPIAVAVCVVAFFVLVGFLFWWTER